jgi:small subunit ribosomal protein S11
MAQTRKKVTSKKDKNSLQVVLFIFNRHLIHSNNLTGDTISWASAGSSGFKGDSKVPFAAQTAAEKQL